MTLLLGICIGISTGALLSISDDGGFESLMSYLWLILFIVSYILGLLEIIFNFL